MAFRAAQAARLTNTEKNLFSPAPVGVPSGAPAGLLFTLGFLGLPRHSCRAFLSRRTLAGALGLGGPTRRVRTLGFALGGLSPARFAGLTVDPALALVLSKPLL